jgi:hypothetical protein
LFCEVEGDEGWCWLEGKMNGALTSGVEFVKRFRSSGSVRVEGI